MSDELPEPDYVGDEDILGYRCCRCGGKIMFDFDRDLFECSDCGQIHRKPEPVEQFVTLVQELRKPRSGNGINR
jgi:hypothetical protein